MLSSASILGPVAFAPARAGAARRPISFAFDGKKSFIRKSQQGLEMPQDPRSSGSCHLAA